MSSATAASGSRGSTTRGDTKVMGTAAAIAGGAGLVLMGPISAAALGTVAAYAATREDKAGSAVRKVGKVGLKAVGKVRTMVDDERGISRRVSSASQNAVSQVIRMDSKYGLSNKAREATTQTQQALVNFNHRHKVADKVSRGLGSTA